MSNNFKLNNEVTRTHHSIVFIITHYPGVTTVDFEQVNASWLCYFRNQ